MSAPYTGAPAGSQPANGGAPGQPPAAPPTVDMLSARIPYGDQRYPKELWGKTGAEAMRFYSIMKEDFVRRNSTPAPSAPPPVASTPPTAPNAGYTPPTTPAAVRGDTDVDDLDARMERVVRKVLGTSPVMTATADGVKERMRRKYPDWMQHEQEILIELGTAPPEMLASEQLWDTAYYVVTGRKYATGQLRPVAPPPSPPVEGQFYTTTPAPNYAPYPTTGPAPVSVPGAPIVTPPPAWNGFVEGSTAPNGNNGVQVDRRLDPNIQLQARRFGVPVDEYVQWLDGKVPSMPASSGGRV